MEITGKTVLLTGATGGLGQATAHALALRGATLVLSSRKPAEQEQEFQKRRLEAEKAAQKAAAASKDQEAKVENCQRARESLATLEGGRRILRTNYPVVRKWIERRAPLLAHAAPDAGAIVFVRYRHGINSTVLVERLRAEQSVLVVPGDHFEMDGFLRIGFGSDPAHLLGSLERIGEMLDSLSPATDAR